MENEGLNIDIKTEISALKHTSTTYNGFSLVVDELMKITEFDKIIQTAQGHHKFNLLEIIKLILIQRFDLPGSKLRTYERQSEHGFQQIDLQHLYRSMDAIQNLSDETSVKNVIRNGGYKKYLKVSIGSSLVLNEEAIERDAEWDGFHGIAVSNSSGLTAEQALSRYRELWHVEEAFRVAKSTLKTRPIFHWVPQRIKAHVLLCFINLFFERFLELLLRKKDRKLTPDRIRQALSQVHTIIFEDKGTKKQGIMESFLSKDAEKIFQTLGISTMRKTANII